MKVVDQGKDSFRRRIDRGRAPDAERIRLGRGEDQDGRNRDREHDSDDGNDFEHGRLRICKSNQRRNSINARKLRSRNHSPPHTISPR
jgi:hypothetical protein